MSSDVESMSPEAHEAYEEAQRRIEQCRVDGATLLDLSGIGVTALPPEIGSLTALTELYLHNNQLSALPPEIGSLTALTKLYLFSNQLSGLPSEIGRLTALTELDFDNNQLSALPPEIGRLTALKGLYLYNNQLSALPPEIGRLTALAGLHLHNNQLRSLPPEIGRLTALTELYLYNNQLRSLPSEIGRLTALTGLYLGGNELSALPPEIGRLTSLKGLHLDNNPLKSLPHEIGQLLELEKIFCESTNIKELPDELIELPHLTHLMLAGNEHLGLPVSIVGEPQGEWGQPNAKEILDFYFSRLEQGERPLNEVKLLLLGRGEAGKTSISRALRGLDFEKGHAETPGIEIQPWTLDCGKEAEDVKVHLWDFAGQEITHETHRFFLTDRSLYVVVLDGRGGQQMEEAEYWLSHVERYGTRREYSRNILHKGEPTISKVERSPVIVVLNKWQTPGPYDVEQRRLQREYPNIVGFVKTDCGTDYGITDLKGALCDALKKMPSVREKWPTSYFDVRQELLDLSAPETVDERRHFLKWEDFRKVCKKYGVTEQNRQHSMAENLNALGVALYYGDDARLRDTRVLNPNWAANGLYGVVRGVNKAPYKGKRGQLWAGEFAEVLDAGMAGMDKVRGAAMEDYPEERDGVKVHDFLLDLMVDRELGFQAGTVNGYPLYLLPGLLAIDEPESDDYDIAAHMESAQVRFQYRYELIPAGVMSRFIVRTHVLSEDLFRWQRGVILKWKGARALVMAERRRNPRMDVFITGGEPAERQELAGVIRANMEAIHRDLPDGLHGIEWLDLSMKGDQYEEVTKLITLEKANEMLQIVTADGPRDVAVTPQLDQLQPKEARSENVPKLKVFVSYSHANYQLWDKFKPHRDILENENLVEVWFDGKIRAGSDWDETIRKELKEADIVVFFLSNEFFASKYIKGVEIKEAKLRHSKGDVEILPVLLAETPARRTNAWFKKLQSVPVVKGEFRPLNSFNPRVNGWNEVQKALREMIAEIAEKRKAR